VQQLLEDDDQWNLITDLDQYNRLRSGYYHINDEKAEGLQEEHVPLSEEERQFFKDILCLAMTNMDGIVEGIDNRDVRKVRALKRLEIELVVYKLVVCTTMIL
jgi:hypothetical protein